MERGALPITACRAVSNPAWGRIFREISCFSPLNLGTLLRCCVLGQGTQCAKTAAGLYALRGVEMAHE